MSQAIYAINDVDREALSRSSGGRSATTKDSDSDAEQLPTTFVGFIAQIDKYEHKMREANKPKPVEEEIVFDASQAQAKNPRLFSSVNVKHISELDLTKLDENLVDGEHFLANQKPSNESKAGIEEINDFDHELISVKEPV